MCFEFLTCCGCTEIMPLTQIVVEGHESFLKKLSEVEVEAQRKKVPLVVIIKSSCQPDGTNWCKDCAQVDKMLQDKLPYMKLQGILLIAKVGTLEEWKDENNQFKHDEKLKLEAVPTAYRWKDGEPIKRLAVPELLSPDNFKSLFK